MSIRPWQEVVQEKRNIQQKLVEPYLRDIQCQNALPNTILDIDSVEGLTSALASGKVTARDVTRTYIRR